MLTNYNTSNDGRFDNILANQNAIFKRITWDSAIGPLPIAVDSSPNIYLDPTGGSDANTGTSTAAAVQSFSRAVDLANGYDNATINIVGSVTVDLGASPSFKARQCINVTGTTTTWLSTTVVTATPRATYLTDTVIVVTDTLVAASLTGCVLTFTSGSFSGQSFNIVTNGVNDITIAGNAPAAGGDSFVVTSPNASLVQSSGTATWKGTWRFTNVTCGATVQSWSADCDSCLVFDSCTLSAVLTSNKHTFIVIEASEIIQDITTEFSDAWLIKNSLVFSITVTWTNIENLLQNVWFDDVTFVTNKSSMIFENCYLNGNTNTINMFTSASFENCVITVDDNSSNLTLQNSSHVIFLSNMLLDGNSTANIIDALTNSEININNCILTITTSGAATTAINVDSTSIINAETGDITINGDYTNGIRIDNGSNSAFVNGSIVFNGGTYTNALLFIFRSNIVAENCPMTSPGVTVGARYLFIEEAAVAKFISSLSFTSVSCPNAMSINGSSRVLIRGTCDLAATGTAISGIGITINQGSRCDFWFSSGTIRADTDGILNLQGELIFANSSNTITGNLGGGGDVDIIGTGDARIVLRSSGITLGGSATITIGGNAPVALPVAPSYVNDFGAGSPEGATFSRV